MKRNVLFVGILPLGGAAGLVRPWNPGCISTRADQRQAHAGASPNVRAARAV